MKVKELLSMLKNANPEAEVVVDVDEGSIRSIDTAKTEGEIELSDPSKWVEFTLVAGDW